jgi:PAS domain S-box-containing protein
MPAKSALADYGGAEVVEWLHQRTIRRITMASWVDERAFEVLLQASPVALLVLAPDRPVFTIVAVTDEYLCATATRRQDLVGRGLFEAFPDNPGLRKSLERVLETRAPDAMPAQNQSNTPIVQHGEVRFIIHRVEDVTDRRREEAHLQSLESVVTSASDAVIFTEAGPLDDPGPRITYVNEGFVRMTGYRREEVMGRSPRFLQGPKTAREVIRRMRAALGRREPVRVEMINYKKDGTPFWVDVSVAPVFDEDGQLVGWTAVQRDMTERKHAEDAAVRLARDEAARLEAQDARQHTTAISERSAFFTLDRQWHVTYLNRQAEQLLGRTRSELVGNIWAELPEWLDSPFGNLCVRAMEEQRELSIEAYWRAHHRWYLVHAFPTADSVSMYFHDVTDRKRIEEQLRESELRLRSLIDNSMDAVLLTSPERGSIEMANTAATELFGYTEEELKSIGRRVVVDPLDLLWPSKVAERRQMGRARGELTMIRKDGSRFPAEVSATLFRDSRGAERSSVSLRDITKRREQEAERERLLASERQAREQAEAANEKLRESEERFRLTIDEAPIGMALVALDGRFVRVNRVLCDLTGYPAEELERLKFQDITHPDDVDADVALAGRLKEGEIPRYHMEKRYIRKDGRIVTINLSVSLLRDSRGSPLYFISQIEDITARKRAEKALRASEEKSSGILSISADAMISIDEDQRITMFNEGAEKIFGYSKAEALGAPLEILIPERFRASHRRHVEKFAAGEAGARRVGEGGGVVGMRKTGEEFPADATISKLEIGGKQILTVALRDITQQRRLEDRLRSAINVRDDVLGIVAHDLRSPLSTIIMQASLLERPGPEPERRNQRPWEGISRAAKRMNQLIQDLLDVAQVEAGGLRVQRAQISARELVFEAIEAQRSLASSSQLKLESDLEQELPEFWGDRNRLLQVFENLLGNAMKFTTAGGQITVGAAATEAEVRFRVSDTGCGISREGLPHVFDRFWQAAKHAGRLGAGLGLTITKGIVEAHGGRIWVESTVGGGTTFFFAIPRSRRPGERTAAVMH